MSDVIGEMYQRRMSSQRKMYGQMRETNDANSCHESGKREGQLA